MSPPSESRPGALLGGLYAGFGTAAAPALRLMLRLRLRRGREIAGRLPERRGIDATARPQGRLLWLHAASVGETVSILPILRELQARDPAAILLVTTGSVTSAQLLTSRLGTETRILHRFVPLDVPAWVARFLDHWRPDAAAFVESELWPNLLAACATRRLPLLLFNARMSEASFHGWQRLPGLASRALAAFHAINARSEPDAIRLRALGARSVTTPGDLKFAADKLPVDGAELGRLRKSLFGRPVWLAASTHDGEEAIALDIHRALLRDHPALLTILAPRHPDRADAVASLAGDDTMTRRSLGQDPPPGRGIWLVDTMGELGLCFRLAGIAFIGNSLLPPGGGHNPLEGARLGCALATGPHTGNFAEAIDALIQAGGLAVTEDETALRRWLRDMLANPARQAAMAKNAAGAADRWSGLPAECAELLLACAG